MRGVCLMIQVTTAVCLLGFSQVQAQTTAPGNASKSVDQRSAKYWLKRGEEALLKVEAKRRAELHALAAVTHARMGDRATAIKHIQHALGEFGSTPEDEQSFVRAEIARAWAWVGEDERAIGFALLSDDEVEVAGTMIRIAVAQDSRGAHETARKTFSTVERTLKKQLKSHWYAQSMWADLAASYQVVGRQELVGGALHRIVLPEVAIDGACLVMLAELRAKKPDAAKIKARVKEQASRLPHLAEEDVEFAAGIIAEVYARAGDVEGAQHLIRSIKDAGLRSYVFASIAAAHARGQQRDAFDKAFKQAIAAARAIRFDADLENDAAYDQAWALGGVAWTLVADGDSDGDDGKRVIAQAKTELERAIICFQIAEARLDAKATNNVVNDLK